MTVEALLAAGFTYERTPGQGGRMWVQEKLDWDDNVPLGVAQEALGRGGHWAIELTSRLVHGAAVPVILSMDTDYGGISEGFVRVGLSTWLSLLDRDTVASRQFLAWTVLLADITDPIYGRASTSIDLMEGAPDITAPIRTYLPPPIQWVNVFGPAYVERLGPGRLLDAPAWRTEFIATGGVALTVDQHPYHATQLRSNLAEYLGTSTTGSRAPNSEQDDVSL